MSVINDEIRKIEQEAAIQLSVAQNEELIEQFRIEFLGRQGKVALLMEQLKTLSLEEKKHAGPALNQLKKSLQDAYEDKKNNLQQQLLHAKQDKQKHFDVTAYRYQPLQGHLHIYTQIIEQIQDIFISMGYDIVDGPEVETDYYNFEALNIPQDHPARDSHDTFWLNAPGKLLRTHTSSVQARLMKSRGAPVALCAPGRVYRNEATDASHDFQFTQVEWLFVDKNVSLANHIATARAFLQQLFGRDDLKIRVRPGFFPFVEPGVEIDLACPFCTQGCSVCKKTTWIELLGSGMIHPNVLRHCGIDPDIYSGFAAGMGIERLAMVKYGINDIRLFHSSVLSFIDQF
jgi:phenylalanyl-tRNA synthetase alpha chain